MKEEVGGGRRREGAEQSSPSSWCVSLMAAPFIHADLSVPSPFYLSHSSPFHLSKPLPESCAEPYHHQKLQHL